MAEEAVSTDINPGNCLIKVQECQKYMTQQMWAQFTLLYNSLTTFQKSRVKKNEKNLDDDEFTQAWNVLRTSSVDSILKNIESSQSFEEFFDWVKRLSNIVTNPRSLWNIIHLEVNCSLKVTTAQSKEIQSTFFTPEQLFEFGLESFIKSPLCALDRCRNEEDFIDIFYACVGYIRASGIPKKYEITQKEFCGLLRDLLVSFSNLPNFKGHRFVWLVESIHDHLHLSEKTFGSICKDVLEIITDDKNCSGTPIHRLYRMCVISTSPLLHNLSVIKSAINKVFASVIRDQHLFVRKYIFGSFINCVWTGDSDGRLSDPIAAWQIYLESLNRKIKDKPEIPDLLILDLINDSLQHFVGYYSEVQPSKSRSENLRRDIFAIVTSCSEFYPKKMGSDTLQKIWFLLAIAAVSGATDEQVNEFKQLDCKEGDKPFLGLGHTDAEFEDYMLALGRLLKKFEGESGSIRFMIDFVRKNYKEQN